MRRLFLLSLCIWSFNKVQAQQPITPADWHPSLDLVRQTLETQFSETKAQQSVNVLTGRLAEVADAELLVVYIQLYEGLSPTKRTELLREQGQWLKAREKRMSSYTHLPPEDRGSATPAEANDDFIQLTDPRIKELQARLTHLHPR